MLLAGGAIAMRLLLVLAFLAALVVGGVDMRPLYDATEHTATQAMLEVEGNTRARHHLTLRCPSKLTLLCVMFLVLNVPNRGTQVANPKVVFHGCMPVRVRIGRLLCLCKRLYPAVKCQRMLRWLRPDASARRS